MNKYVRHAGIRTSVGLAMLGVAAFLIGSGGIRASCQANLVRVVSPADLILQPTDPDAATVKLDFEFGAGVSYVMLSGGNGAGPFKLYANGKTMHWGICGSGHDSPGDRVTMTYDAFDSAGAKIGSGSWEFTIGPDTTKPAVRIVSPKNGTLVGPGEVIDVVVAGEESKSAPTWQTGMRRLTLVDPALNLQTSPETPYKACDGKQWTKEHHFRYVVPRDATAGQIISLKAGAEDWAKNVGLASLDLIVQVGLAGVWTTQGRFVGPDIELTFTIEAVFSFTLNPRSGAVTCGTASQPYCGSASVTLDPGRSKGASGWCVLTRTPSFSVFKIRAGGVRQGNEMKFLQIQMAESVPVGYRYDCPGGRADEPGGMDMAVGSMEPEGITIAIPLRDHTTATKHESSNASPRFELDHKVELYPPRQNR